MDKNANTGGIFSDRLEALIAAALQDGVLTDKERELLKRRAEKEGEDWDEVEMIINARLTEMQSKIPQTVSQPAISVSSSMPEMTSNESKQNNNSTSLSLKQAESRMSMEEIDETMAEIKKQLDYAHKIMTESTKNIDNKSEEKAPQKIVIATSRSSIYGDSYEDLMKWKKDKLEDLKIAIDHRKDSPEAKERFKRLANEYEEIKTAVRNGAVTVKEVVQIIQGGPIVLEEIVAKEAKEKAEEEEARKKAEEEAKKKVEEETQKIAKVKEAVKNGNTPVELFNISNGELKGFGNISYYGISESDIGILTIPDEIKAISCNAFELNDSIREVRFSSNSNLETIGDEAFSNCSKLSTILFPPSLLKIGDGAFAFCKIKEIYLPDSITFIGDEAFSFCDKLSKIVMPASLDDLGENVFESCGSAKIMDMSKVTKLKTIPKGYGIYNEEDTVIPQGVITICDGAFNHCNNNTNLFLPPSLRSFEDTSSNGWDAIVLFAPQVDDLETIITNCIDLFVLPQYLDEYKAQKEALGYDEDEYANISPIPDEYLYFYDN